jgi:hypothetical protein
MQLPDVHHIYLVLRVIGVEIQRQLVDIQSYTVQ